MVRGLGARETVGSRPGGADPPDEFLAPVRGTLPVRRNLRRLCRGSVDNTSASARWTSPLSAGNSRRRTASARSGCRRCTVASVTSRSRCSRSCHSVMSRRLRSRPLARVMAYSVRGRSATPSTDAARQSSPERRATRPSRRSFRKVGSPASAWASCSVKSGWPPLRAWMAAAASREVSGRRSRSCSTVSSGVRVPSWITSAVRRMRVHQSCRSCGTSGSSSRQVARILTPGVRSRCSTQIEAELASAQCRSSIRQRERLPRRHGLEELGRWRRTAAAVTTGRPGRGRRPPSTAPGGGWPAPRPTYAGAGPRAARATRSRHRRGATCLSASATGSSGISVERGRQLPDATSTCPSAGRALPRPGWSCRCRPRR